MKDEEYLYRSDVREKAITARSARRTRTHCGKGGAVKLPSDYLTRKELNAMNGEVKSYRLNDPMTWKEFKMLPDDVKVLYITQIRSKWNTPDNEIAKMLGICKETMIRCVTDLGINKGKKGGGKWEWDKDGFYAWAFGTPLEVKTANEVEPAPDAIAAAREETKLPVEAFEKHPANEESVTVEELAKKKTCCESRPNYEAEYFKLLEEYKALCAKLHYVTEEHKAKEIEFEKMRAQLDIVHLIFGGK